ncbi:MAG: SUMF1/EgtB/PvdO family nonheme iron enzyme [Polyangiaceae bacterium]
MSASKLAFVAAEEALSGPREEAHLPTGSRPSAPRPPEAAVSCRSIDLDESIDLGPDALAGTLGVVDTVISTEQIAELQPAERYMPMGPIGRGGMGRVDMVFDRALGRPVARKTVLRRQSSALLLTEAQIGAQLEHPSIVPVYDVAIDERGRPHYTMRVIRGRTLRDVIEARRLEEKGAMTLAQALGVFRQVCLAADYAHSRGVVHRDLKPENVVVGEYGEVYVLDWGVACLTAESDIHRAGHHVSLPVAGTLGYMPPEQMKVGPLDARADIFALGVILHEIVTGVRPSDDGEPTRAYDEPPTLARAGHVAWSIRPMPAPFDALVAACLELAAEDRPSSARLLADAIDEHLDGERARAERRREADAHTQEGESAREAFDALDAEASRLDRDASRLLNELRPWEGAERKLPAWELSEQAERLRAEASRALARGEAAFARALGREPDHAGARRGLAALYYRQFVAAEVAGDPRKMAQYLDLARAYDDGPLSLELGDEGMLEVRSAPEPAEVSVARYEQHGFLLAPASERALGPAPVHAVRLPSGSYLVTLRRGDAVVRYPLVVRRAHKCSLAVRFENLARVPAGMVLIPGGPFAAVPPRETRAAPAWLPDFAIARFPVTFREYAELLDDLEDPEIVRLWAPVHRGSPLIEKDAGGRWRLLPHAVEGEGRRRVPEERELDVPVFGVSWFQAAGYARWLARKTGCPYRLPTDLEWEKAARGADARAYPMGNRIDPSFAKLRESRPEAAQPEPIGAFANDESPYGVRDLAGGVSDWTCTSVSGARLAEPVGEGRGPVPAGADEQLAFHRGGNWGITNLSHMRYPAALHSRSTGVGFRLALDVDPGMTSDLAVTPLAGAVPSPPA